MSSVAEKNEALRTLLWEGSIPMLFTLAESEVVSEGAPVSVQRTLSRMSFLGPQLAETLAYFRSFSLEFSSKLYLVSNGVVLPWHLPVGALFDAIGAKSFRTRWCVDVYFRVPSGQQWEGMDNAQFSFLDTEKLYFHGLKQALHTLYGSSRSFNELSVEQQKVLWQAVLDGDGRRFREAETVLVGPQSSANKRAVPLRIVNNLGSFTQKVVRLQSEGAITLRDALNKHFRSFVESCDHVVIQGISVSLDVSLFELWESFHHSDLFLYVFLPN